MVITPSVGVVPQYFDKRRGLANALSNTGSTIGSFTLSPLWVILVDYYSPRGAFILLGGIFLQVTACSALIRPLESGKKQTQGITCIQSTPSQTRDSISTIGVKRDSVEHVNSYGTSVPKVGASPIGTCEIIEMRDSKSMEDIEFVKVHNCKPPVRDLNEEHKSRVKCYPSNLQLTLLKDPFYVVFLVGHFLSMVCFQGAFLCLPLYLDDMGFEQARISLIIAVMSIAELAGRLFIGMLLDIHSVKKRVRITTVFSASLTITGIMTFIISQTQSIELIIGFTVVFGIFGGQIFGLIALVLIELFGNDNVMNTLGYTEANIGLAEIVTPILIGKLILFLTLYQNLNQAPTYM